MDSKPRKLRQQTNEELAQEKELSAQQQQHVVREFKTVEELLQHDAEQTVVPPHIAARVQESIAREPQPRGWWGRLFGR